MHTGCTTAHVTLCTRKCGCVSACSLMPDCVRTFVRPKVVSNRQAEMTTNGSAKFLSRLTKMHAIHSVCCVRPEFSRVSGYLFTVLMSSRLNSTIHFCQGKFGVRKPGNISTPNFPLQNLIGLFLTTVFCT